MPPNQPLHRTLIDPLYHPIRIQHHNPHRRHLDAVSSVTRQLKGLGSRHRAAASITMQSKAIAVVISESTGRVTVFDEGKIIAVLDPVISTRVA